MSHAYTCINISIFYHQDGTGRHAFFEMKDEESHRGECAHKHVDNGNHNSLSCSISSVYNDFVLLFIGYGMICSGDSHSILPKGCMWLD